MHINGYLSGAFLALAGFLAFEGSASAAEDPSDPATADAPPAVRGSSAGATEASPDVPKTDDGDANLKRFSIELNPLSVSIGRYSLTGEYMLAKHHAVVLTPHFTHAPVTVTVNGQEIDGGALNGFGGELGYRFYTGSAGANGFYIGPSFVFSSFSQSAPSGSSGSSSSDSFTAIGGAVDLGGQAIIGPGIVLGGGFGLQYTVNSKDIATDNLNLASAIIAGGGIRPRFLFTIGYSF